MSQRHTARTIALQSLSEWDFKRFVLKKEFVDINKIIERNFKEFVSLNFEEKNFSKDLAKSVINNLEKIDKIINDYAPQWPINKITIVDRNILRIGIDEIVFIKEVPPKVAINEAIEIAKAFGGINSGRFVNGILGSLYEDIKNGKYNGKI